MEWTFGFVAAIGVFFCAYYGLQHAEHGSGGAATQRRTALAALAAPAQVQAR